MNYDELAFFNEQLAAMLREGIPLEGALKQLASGMSSAALRIEFEALAADLSRGIPLSEAIGRRSLPEFYRRLVQVGARSNDLPGVLTLVADYYHRVEAVWTRLKGLMVYPLLVIIVSLGLTFILSMAVTKFMSVVSVQYLPTPPASIAAVWAPPLVLAWVAIVIIAVAASRRQRSYFRWRLPAFREASLAQLGSAISLMLRNGATLTEALAMAESLEAGSPAARTLAHWRAQVEGGHGKPDQWTGPHWPFPDLFVWLVRKRGEDLAGGFQKAADLYQARANHKVEMLLYGALPVSILLLGQMLLWQVLPLGRSLVYMLNVLGDMSNL